MHGWVPVEFEGYRLLLVLLANVDKDWSISIMELGDEDYFTRWWKDRVHCKTGIE